MRTRLPARLGAVVRRLGHPPVVALTATAAPPVRTGPSPANSAARSTIVGAAESAADARGGPATRDRALPAEADRMTVLFAERGYKTLAFDAVRAHDLVEPVEG